MRSVRARASLATKAEDGSLRFSGQSAILPCFSVSAHHRAKRSRPSPASARKRSKSRRRERERPAEKTTSRASRLSFQMVSRSIGSTVRLVAASSSRDHWMSERRGPDRRVISGMASGRM